MENYVCINGCKFELTKDQLKVLGVKTPNPFDKVEYGRPYYYILKNGDVIERIEADTSVDKRLFNAANYCSNKAIMEQRALCEIFNRLLWRYAMTHKAPRVEYKYEIHYNFKYKKWTVDAMPDHFYIAGEIFFDSEKIAQDAIKEVIDPFVKAHPEFTLEEWR